MGIFCAGAGSPSGAGFVGDATYTAGPLGEARTLVAPINSPQVLAKFPPTLVKLNFAAELHVWEALFHGFFYNPDVPESRDCYDVIVEVFNHHLGSGVKENP